MGGTHARVGVRWGRGWLSISPTNLQSEIQEGFAGVHFGALRVVDDATRSLVLKNGGRYDAAFKFAVASQAVGELVEISPAEGLLAPGKEATVVVRCLCILTSA